MSQGEEWHGGSMYFNSEQIGMSEILPGKWAISSMLS